MELPRARALITSQLYKHYEHKDIIAVKETVCALLHPNRTSLYEWTCNPSVLLKYNLDSQSWQTVPSFDWGPREDVCLVSLEKYLYAVGGHSPPMFERRICLCAASRYDTILDMWEKIAHIQKARHSATHLWVRNACLKHVKRTMCWQTSGSSLQTWRCLELWQVWCVLKESCMYLVGGCLL